MAQNYFRRNYDWHDKCYRSSYGNHDIVDWNTIVSNKYQEPVPIEEISPMRIVYEFLLGIGQTKRNFQPNDKFTQQFARDNERLNELYEQISDQIFNSGKLSGMVNYSLSKKEKGERLSIFSHDLLNASISLLSGSPRCDKVGNVAASIIGSFTLSWSLHKFNDDGSATIKISICNDMSAKSFLKPPMTGYTPFWQKKIAPQIQSFFDNGAKGTGVMNTINMNIEWTANIKNSYSK